MERMARDLGAGLCLRNTGEPPGVRRRSKVGCRRRARGPLALYNCDIGEWPVQVKRFSELYPKIKVTTYVASCWQTYNRHVAERGAGRPIADAFISTDDVFMKMDDEGMLEGYDSPEQTHFPSDARPNNANYLRYKALLAAFTVNPEQMKGQPTPQDWTDFAKPAPQWKDKISFYDPRTSSLAFTVLATLHQHWARSVHERSMRA